LEVFFNQIEKNFKPKKLKKLPRIGDIYTRVDSKDGCETFFSCKVLDIYNYGHANYIKIEYDDYDINNSDDSNDSVNADDILDEEGTDWDDDLFIDIIIYEEYNFII
jgi:hypothetical protein